MAQWLTARKGKEFGEPAHIYVNDVACVTSPYVTPRCPTLWYISRSALRKARKGDPKCKACQESEK